MPGLLPEILAHKRQEVVARRLSLPQASLETAVKPGAGSFRTALSGDGLRLIAEVKPASPSAGTLRPALDLPSILASYNRYASAISVLTDQKYFNGSLGLLREVVKTSSHPVLCKDFVVDPYQVYEARLAGAEAVLVIVKALDQATIREIYQIVLGLGMTPVLEIQNEPELERALGLSPSVVMINNRDLNSLAVDLQTTVRLAPLIPPEVLTVAASGIKCREDVNALLPYCCRFLIGSSLMRSPDLDATLRELSGL